MKSFILGLLLCSSIFAWGQGVDFRDLTFKESLQRAREEKKLVFVDCYTTWCGPCMYMMNTIFPMKEAGDYFNSRFVCLKYDMDKGEGKRLRKEWGVTSFPSFFIFQPDSTMQHKIVGATYTLEKFVAIVEKGLDKKTSYAYLSKKYAKGTLKKSELLAYQVAAFYAGDVETSRQIKNDLKSQLTDRDKLKKEFWPLFEEEECVVGTHDFNLLLDNISKFEKAIGKEKLDAYLYKSYCVAILYYLTGEKHPNVSLEELSKQVQGLNIARKKELQIRLDIADCVVKKDLARMWEKLESPDLDALLDGITAVQVLEKQFTQADYKHFADWLERKLADSVNSSVEEHLKAFFEFYSDKVYKGVDFQDMSLEEALSKARQEQKMVFVDCYTTWCGPCKKMNNNIFPLKEMGDYFNSRFVCLKFDMDRPEYKEFGKKWSVEAYPSFIIFQADGTRLHQIVGGNEQADKFISRIAAGLIPKKNIHYLQQQYENRAITNLELLDYMFVLREAYRNEDAKVIYKELLERLSEEEKLQKEFWPIFEEEECVVGTRDFDLLLANLPVFEKNVGREKLDEYLYNSFANVLSCYIGGLKDKVSLAKVEAQIQGLNICKKSNLLLLVKLAQCVQARNKQELFRVLESNITSFHGKELMEACSAIQSLRLVNFVNKDYVRVAQWLDKVKANPQNKGVEESLERRIAFYKSNVK